MERIKLAISNSLGQLKAIRKVYPELSGLAVAYFQTFWLIPIGFNEFDLDGGFSERLPLAMLDQHVQVWILPEPISKWLRHDRPLLFKRDCRELLRANRTGVGRHVARSQSSEIVKEIAAES